MPKINVTLISSSPPLSFEFPEGIERSCFGAIRLFQGVMRTITLDELNHIKTKYKKESVKIKTSKYVESKRVDKRGYNEDDINYLAKEHNLLDLPLKNQIKRLKKLGLI